MSSQRGCSIDSGMGHFIGWNVRRRTESSEAADHRFFVRTVNQVLSNDLVVRSANRQSGIRLVHSA